MSAFSYARLVKGYMRAYISSRSISSNASLFYLPFRSSIINSLKSSNLHTNMASSVSDQKIWFITGASTGLGLELALAALREGHRVIGTGRNITQASSGTPEFENLGGRWLQVDVSKPESEEIIRNTIAQEESNLQDIKTPHWVVVNNAGSSLLGAVEDMSDDQISDYLQVNVFGPIRVWRAALPTLRRHLNGTLITVSSLWGFVPKCENMMYSAVKSSLESLTDSYAELLPYARVMIIQPGGFRTGFASHIISADLGTSEDYKAKMSSWSNIVEAAAKDNTTLKGDPQLFGQRLLDSVESRNLFESIWKVQPAGKALRVQFGSDCYELVGQRLKSLRQEYEMMEAIGKSTDMQ